MTISPIRPGIIIPAGLLSNATAPKTSMHLEQGRAMELLFKAQAQVRRDTHTLAPNRDARWAIRDRHKAKRLADSILREALREEAAVKSRIRQRRRELAAMEHASSGRARLAFSPAELHELMQTALRLNIQA